MVVFNIDIKYYYGSVWECIQYCRVLHGSVQYFRVLHGSVQVAIRIYNKSAHARRLR